MRQLTPVKDQLPPLNKQSKESEYPNDEIMSSVSESNDNYETGHDEFTNGAKSKLPSKSLAKSKLFKRGKELPDDDGDDESEEFLELGLDGEWAAVPDFQWDLFIGCFPFQVTLSDIH